MKVLAVSDQELDQVYELASGEAFRGVSMVLGCGDLHYSYLEFLVTVLNVELFYVPGNHDLDYNPGTEGHSAPGCINLDLGSTRIDGLILAGYGGSLRYRPNGTNQYSQQEAFARLARLVPRLMVNRRRFGRACDVLITHSPPYGIHDGTDPAHQGLKAINWLMDWAQPRYVLHGHMHYVQSNLMRDTTMQGKSAVTVMNVYPYRVIEIPDVR
jgi:Icc-related predicted phosphoesterase